MKIKDIYTKMIIKKINPWKEIRSREDEKWIPTITLAIQIPESEGLIYIPLQNIHHPSPHIIHTSPF